MRRSRFLAALETEVNALPLTFVDNGNDIEMTAKSETRRRFSRFYE